MLFYARKGIALIMGVAVLGVLCILAVSFAKITQLDQSATASYELNAHARFLANAGIHFTACKVREHITQHGISSWDNAILQNPYQKAVNQQLLYQYTVEAHETSSFLNINYPDAVIETDVNDPSKKDYPLERMLKNLALYLGIPEAKAESVAKGIVTNRPAVETDGANYIRGGYQSLDQWKELAQIDKDTWAILKPYLGTHGWVNTYSIVYKKGAGGILIDNISTAKRTPVNVNCASKEVIAAVLCGIKSNDGTEISYEKALETAEYIVANRPFCTWDEFRQELRVCTGINFKEAELIFLATTTNAHTRNYDEPNYYTNYISPEGHYSKSDIIVSNTEFTLGPLGCFSLRSTGQILQDGKIITQFTVSSMLKMFECYRMSSEREYDLACIKDQSNGSITGPFSGDESTTYHNILGNLMIDFFSEEDGYQLIPGPGGVITATGGGGSILLGEIVNGAFSLTSTVDKDGKLENPIELYWINDLDTYKVCRHLRYNASENNLRISSLLVGDPEKGILQKSGEICYKTKIRQDWQSALKTVLTHLHRNSSAYFCEASSPKNPEIGDTRMIFKANAELEEQFYSLFWEQVYNAFATGTSGSFSLPLNSIFEYDLERWDGTAWLYVGTFTTTVNATEYLKISNFLYPYMSLFDGIFDNMPSNMLITRPNVHNIAGYQYQEYINKDIEFIHPFDRSRWEKKVEGPFSPYSCIIISVEPSTVLEPNLSVKCMEFVAKPNGQKQIQTTNLIVQNDEPKMGSTLNYWCGNLAKSASSGKTIFQPAERKQAVYVGKFVPHIPGSAWWNLGTLRWTGYSPIDGTSIQMFFEGKEVFQDGTWKVPFKSKLYQKGDEIRFTVHLNNDTDQISGRTQPMITPFFEEVSCFAMVEIHFYYYQEEWNY